MEAEYADPSFCLVPPATPLTENCPTCGCPPTSHVQVEGEKFICVTCDFLRDKS